jgi:FtsH-binding integral membrane protein
MTMTGQYVGTYETLSLGSFIVSSRAFYWFIFVASFVLLFALLCFKSIYPVNYFLLAGWTLAISCSVASACVIVLCDPMVVNQKLQQEPIPLSIALKTPGSLQLYQNSNYCAVGTDFQKHGTNSVLMALGITTSLFLGLTAFTLQSKWDFSFLGAGLSSVLWILLFWGICMSLFGSSSELRYLYSLAGAIIFSLYIVFDTWKISQVYGPDDYILGAIDLYLDIINLFLFILRLLNDRR